MAKHLLENDYNCSLCNVKLKKGINNSRRLDDYDRFFISKHYGQLMNHDPGIISSLLFGFNLKLFLFSVSIFLNCIV